MKPSLKITGIATAFLLWGCASMPDETVARAGNDGILGVDFLRRYALEFSTQDRVIRLYSPDRLDG